MWRRVLAIPVLLLGIADLAWVGYNVFGQRQPEFQGRTVGQAAFGVALIVIGIQWLRGKVAE